MAGDLSALYSQWLTLAVTWNPRGELSRFEKLLPMINGVYDAVVISFPPSADRSTTKLFTRGRYASDPSLHISINKQWSWGRHTALRLALETPADFIQYGDMDRMLRWIETRPVEWQEIAHKIKTMDCLIIGRTESAYDTHPKALRQTEEISNRVVSYFLGEHMDVSAGSKGFSRKAAEYLVSHCTPGHALGTDSEWPIMLQLAGFKINYLTAEGLTWESADRYHDRAANSQEQRHAADDYDADPANWAYRVSVAQEIVETAIQAATSFKE